MEVFHVLGVGSNITALKMMDRKSKVLISAWSYWDKQNSLYRREREFIRERCETIIVDSGFLSAAKNGCMGWANQLDKVLECAEELHADRVSMMDIPMEPHILTSAGFVRRDGRPDFDKALEMTYRNAEQMMKANTKASKGFVNQGWTLEQRAECHKTMLAMGVGEVAGWWGIGSVCMRTPATGLFEHVEWARQNIEGYLHCFGIAQGSWIRYMASIGINSCDSGSAAIKAAFGQVVANGRSVQLLKNETLRRSQRMSALLYWYNMEAIEFEVSNPAEIRFSRIIKPQQARLEL